MTRPILIRATLLDTPPDEDGNLQVLIDYAPGTETKHSRVRFVGPQTVVELPRPVVDVGACLSGTAAIEDLEKARWADDRLIKGAHPITQGEVRG